MCAPSAVGFQVAVLRFSRTFAISDSLLLSDVLALTQPKWLKEITKLDWKGVRGLFILVFVEGVWWMMYWL
jgi:hypothetical protein